MPPSCSGPAGKGINCIVNGNRGFSITLRMGGVTVNDFSQAP